MSCCLGPKKKVKKVKQPEKPKGKLSGEKK